MISKKDFCEVIDGIRTQIHLDKVASEAIKEALNITEDIVFNNSTLFKSIMKMLQLYFPKDSDGFCEIEYYCFFIEFGKEQDQDLMTDEDLYDRLIKSKK